MSLRAIHIVFIVASILLAVLTTMWGATMYLSERGEIGHLLFALGSLGAVAVMTVYGVRFVRKTREIGIH